LITQKPFYRRGEIEVSRYIADGEAVESFGLGATFVAPVDASAKAVYQVTKEVVENFDDFKSLHPSLSNLSLQDLPSAGVSAPLHPGAERYFKEAKLLR